MLNILFFFQHTIVFSIALSLVVLIAVIEGLGLLVGTSLSGLIDGILPDLDIDAMEWLGWLHIGKVPILILLLIFLTTFSLTGFSIEILWHGFTGSYLWQAVATIPAFFAGIGAVRGLGGLLSNLKIEESQSVSEESFLGRVAVVIQGIARDGNPAQAKLRDEHGRTHYVRVEPDINTESFEEGQSVLLVRKAGSVFMVIANPHPELLD